MTTQTNVDNLTPEQIAGMDMDQLSALVDANSDAEPGVTDESPNPDDGAKDKEPEAKPEVQTEIKPEGVATKDGKAVIPYEVLEKTRNEAAEARKRAELAETQKADAETKLKELSKKLESQDFDGLDDADLFKDDEIDVLSEDLPEVAEKLKAMQNKYRIAANNLQKKDQQILEVEKSTQQSTVQQAIDSVPKIAWIQTNNPRLFKLAIDIDAELLERAKTDPELKGLSISERFEKVAELLEKDIGFEIKLPSNDANKDKKEIEVKETKINGLDDIPGGSSPITDEVQAKLERSPTELAASFDKMTAEQLSDFVERASKFID